MAGQSPRPWETADSWNPQAFQLSAPALFPGQQVPGGMDAAHHHEGVDVEPGDGPGLTDAAGGLRRGGTVLEGANEIAGVALAVQGLFQLGIDPVGLMAGAVAQKQRPLLGGQRRQTGGQGFCHGLDVLGRSQQGLAHPQVQPLGVGLQLGHHGLVFPGKQQIGGLDQHVAGSILSELGQGLGYQRHSGAAAPHQSVPEPGVGKGVDKGQAGEGRPDFPGQIGQSGQGGDLAGAVGHHQNRGGVFHASSSSPRRAFTFQYTIFSPPVHPFSL